MSVKHAFPFPPPFTGEVSPEGGAGSQAGPSPLQAAARPASPVNGGGKRRMGRIAP